MAKAAVQPCIAAGADESLIPRWTTEGRRRAEAARKPPFSQPARRAPRRPRARLTCLTRTLFRGAVSGGLILAGLAPDRSLAVKIAPYSGQIVVA